MVNQNLGKVDRVLRFALAFWWLGPWQLNLIGWLGLAAAIIGWVALVESFVGWCPLHSLLKINNKNQ